MADDEVTAWIRRLGNGDEEAAQAIYQRYFQRLVRLARRRLEGLPRRAADEEDIALSAMKSFYRRMAAGRFPRLQDRNDLWRLLVAMTARKAIDQARQIRTQKRGGGHVRGESVFRLGDGSGAGGGIEGVLGKEPTPEFAAMVAENCAQLLEDLDDETLKTVALYKMEGYSNDEIAAELGYTSRTVARKLARIRQKWQPENEP